VDSADSQIGEQAHVGDGRVIRTARRAHKSAAGYDLTRLFVDSKGTLGIFTEVTLRLHGIPEATAVATCIFADVGATVDAATTIIQFGVTIGRIELAEAARWSPAIVFEARSPLRRHPVLRILWIAGHRC
jgi:D-lactate dehydrogenase (cytochrome)